MKNKKISLLFLSLSFITALFITSCDIKNPVDGIELRVKTMARTTVANLSIYDAATGNMIKPDKVTVTFQGKMATKLFQWQMKLFQVSLQHMELLTLLFLME